MEFPNDLFSDRMEALNYKVLNPMDDHEAWEEAFFEKYPQFVVAQEEEEDEEQDSKEPPQVQLSPAKQGQDVAFHSAIKRLHLAQSQGSLALPAELSRKRHSSAQSDTSKKSRMEDSDLEITEYFKPISPIPPAPRVKAMNDRVATLESLLATVARDVRTLASRPAPAASVARNPNPDESADFDSEMVSTKLNREERRVLWLNYLRDLSPELAHHEQAPESLSSHFETFKPKEEKTIMPFCTSLKEELLKASKLKGSDKKSTRDPFKWVDRAYKTMEPMESTFLQPRSVPMELWGEVAPSKLQNAGASGAEARLKTDSPAGQKEVAALRDTKQASSFIRVINSQELAISALKKLVDTQAEKIEDILQESNLPQAVSQPMKTFKTNNDTMKSAIENLQQGNGALARCTIIKHTQGLKDRQEAWLTSSTLPKPLQAEISRADLAFPQGSSSQPLSLLGDEAQVMVKNHVQVRKDDIFKDWFRAKSRTSGAAKKAQAKKKPQKQDLSYEAHAAGWQQTPFRGRGTSRGNRGRGRGNRGAKNQPFSKPDQQPGQQ